MWLGANYFMAQSLGFRVCKMPIKLFSTSQDCYEAQSITFQKVLVIMNISNELLYKYISFHNITQQLVLFAENSFKEDKDMYI